MNVILNFLVISAITQIKQNAKGKIVQKVSK